MRTGCSAAVFLLLLCVAIDDVSPSAPDNRGKLFIVGFGQNSGKSLDTELFVTTSKTTNVNVVVTAPKYTAQSINEAFTVTAGTVKQLFLDNDLRMVGSVRENKGIQVSADDEVIVYGVNKEYYSCDAYLALPVDVLGTEYYHVSWYPSSYYCQIVVIGVEDSTSVQVKLSSHVGNQKVSFEGGSYGSGQTISTTLQKYQMLQLQTKGDLTGSYITSNKKIGVLGGNQRTNIGSGGSSDHIVEQLTPVDTWGKNFITVPIPLRTTGDYFKFIASEDNTRVVISGGYSSTFTISQKGTFVQKTLPSSKYTKVVADKPISVFQFCMSQQSSNEESDPMLMLIPPMEQYGADYTFSTPKWSYGSYSNYFMFVVKSSERSGLRHNGNAFPGSTSYHSVAGTDYVAGYISIPEGSHVIRHNSPISIFGGYLYGQARYETYGFPTGMRMAPVNTVCVPSPTVVGDGIDNDCDGKIDEELCTVENKGADDDGDGVAEEDCAKPPPIDGEWGNWGSYGTCSISCTASGSSATGTYTRTRQCDNPAPKYDGKQCVGSGSQSSSCTSSTYCPINGGFSNWGSWGSCSVTCASGTQSRSRSCNNPTPQYGGSQCSGSTTSSKTCTKSACPINGGYSAWSSWGSCSKSCGTGSQSKSRSCNNPAPQHGGASCSGSSSATQNCNTHNCPIHGGLTSWTSWGTCTLTCGSGTQGRTRTCTNPTPQYGGNDCTGSRSQSQACNTHHCPIDGGYSAWSSWGSCSKSCGTGSQSKSRSCTNPAPQYGGASCSGSSSATQNCNTHNCPIHGGLTSWTSWGTCTLTCGSGTHGRTRTCTNPTPQYGGNDCTGSRSQSQACNTHHCPIDGGYTSWSSWNTCTVTCGGGTQQKFRSCTNPAPQYGGAQCSGAASSTQNCNTHHCPIDGGYTTWSSWDTCTVTCGGGTQGRTRSCTNPAPQYGGAACSGSPTGIQSCNTHHCPIDGAWTLWTSWSTCTVTCGGGSQERTRTCTNPSPQYGGANCPSVGWQQQACNTQTCIIDGAWGAWGSWGSCSVTCGGGKYSRSRTCSDPYPQNGGLPCAGDSSSFDNCNTAACPTPSAGQYVQLCPTGWFTCQSGTISCIDQSFVCDCANDCDDGSEETTTYAGCSPSLLAACPSSAHLTVSFPVMTFVITLVSVVLAVFGGRW